MEHNPGQSGGAAGGDEVGQAWDGGCGFGAEAGAKIVPEGDVEFPACFGEAEEGIASIAAGVGSSCAADFAADDLTSDIVFRPIGVQRDFRPVEDAQQLRLVGVEPSE